MEIQTDKRSYWANFVTGAHDYREVPATDEEAIQYIPQWPAAQSLYKLYREDWGEGNLSPFDAMTKVLEKIVGR